MSYVPSRTAASGKPTPSTKVIPEESKLFKYQFPNLVKKYKEVGVNYKPTIEDYKVTNFWALVDKDTVERRVQLMTRRIELDRKTHKKVEYVNYFVGLTGRDNKGHPLNLYIDYGGRDQDVYFEKIEDEETGEITWKPGVPFDVWTIPFSKEAVEKILEENPETDISEVQLGYNGSRSWVVGSIEEFTQLDSLELEYRGREGRTGFPLDVRFSRMSGRELLDQEKNRKK